MIQALPFFAFTAPLPADQALGVNGKIYTMWDKITIKGSSKSPVETITLRKFIDKVKKSAEIGDSMEIGNISYGPYMIYANFLNSDDEELLNSPLMSIVESAVVSEEGSDDMALDEGAEAEAKANTDANNMTDEQKSTLSRLAKKRYIDFSVSVEDTETGEEYELPPIRLEKNPSA
jgi:ubiquitin-activating enzyme E1